MPLLPSYTVSQGPNVPLTIPKLGKFTIPMRLSPVQFALGGSKGNPRFFSADGTGSYFGLTGYYGTYPAWRTWGNTKQLYQLYGFSLTGSSIAERNMLLPNPFIYSSEIIGNGAQSGQPPYPNGISTGSSSPIGGHITQGPDALYSSSAALVNVVVNPPPAPSAIGGLRQLTPFPSLFFDTVTVPPSYSSPIFDMQLLGALSVPYNLGYDSLDLSLCNCVSPSTLQNVTTCETTPFLLQTQIDSVLAGTNYVLSPTPAIARHFAFIDKGCEAYQPCGYTISEPAYYLSDISCAFVGGSSGFDPGVQVAKFYPDYPLVDDRVFTVETLHTTSHDLLYSFKVHPGTGNWLGIGKFFDVPGVAGIYAGNVRGSVFETSTTITKGWKGFVTFGDAVDQAAVIGATGGDFMVAQIPGGGFLLGGVTLTINWPVAGVMPFYLILPDFSGYYELDVTGLPQLFNQGNVDTWGIALDGTFFVMNLSAGGNNGVYINLWSSFPNWGLQLVNPLLTSVGLACRMPDPCLMSFQG